MAQAPFELQVGSSGFVMPSPCRGLVWIIRRAPDPAAAPPKGLGVGDPEDAPAGSRRRKTSVPHVPRRNGGTLKGIFTAMIPRLTQQIAVTTGFRGGQGTGLGATPCWNDGL